MSGIIPDGMTHKQAQLYLRAENEKWPKRMTEVPVDRWLPANGDSTNRLRVFRSRYFMVQVFSEKNGVIRFSVTTTTLKRDMDAWEDGITWDDIQRVKSECGYSSFWAVEIFPPDEEVVNVANVRHIWLLPEAPAFAWRKDGPR